MKRTTLNFLLAVLALSFSAANAQTLNYVAKFNNATPPVAVNNSIIYDNGTAVGIGTNNPFNTLHVKTTTNQNFVVEPGASRGGATVDGVGIVSLNDANTQFRSLVLQGSQILLQPAGGSNVGIGTVTPDEKLAVNGSIHSKEVRVDLTGWGDYVFDKSYKLPSLSSVKSYIDLNHHLPDMPSEKELLKSGLKLGEMQTTLTKKVEELTLYMIDKDKQIDEQKQINQSLQQQLNLLKRQLNKQAGKSTKKH